MKFTLCVLIILTIRISCFAQLTIDSDGLGGQLFVDEQGLRFYNRGIDAFEKYNFREADSLFTLALSSYKNEDVYYNRAMTKVLLKDTLGFCSDLNIAAYIFYDKTAAQIFNHSCCNKADTIYHDKKGLLTDNTNYRYLEVVLVPKYEKDTIAYIHHRYKKDKVGVSDNGLILGNMAFRNTDIVGIYYLRSGVKTYYRAEKHANFSANVALISRKKIDFRNKYGHPKDEKDTETVLGIKFLVDQNGQISNIRLEETIPIMLDEKVQQEMEKDVQEMISQCIISEPAQMFNENVDFEYYYLFRF